MSTMSEATRQMYGSHDAAECRSSLPLLGCAEPMLFGSSCPGGIDAGYFDNLLLMDLCARSYFYEFKSKGRRIFYARKPRASAHSTISNNVRVSLRQEHQSSCSRRIPLVSTTASGSSRSSPSSIAVIEILMTHSTHRIVLPVRFRIRTIVRTLHPTLHFLFGS